MNSRLLQFLQMSTAVFSSNSLSSSARTAIRANSSNSNVNNRQLFVSGLRIKPQQQSPAGIDISNQQYNDAVTDQLMKAFKKYGPVENIVIHGLNEYLDEEKKNVRRPHAFVTFSTEQAAKDAMLDRTNAKLYRRLKPSTGPHQKQSHKISKQQEIRNLENDEFVKSLSSRKISVDAVLQVNKSHLHRVVEYLPEITHGAVKVVGIQESSQAKKISLIFIELVEGRMSCRQLVENYLGNNVYLIKALNKLYDFSARGSVVNGSESDVCTEVCEALNALQGDIDEQIIVKLVAFPLHVQRGVLNVLEEKLPQNIEITPKGNTHAVNIVRVDSPLSQRKISDTIDCNSGCYLWGISSVYDALIGSGGREISDEESSSVSRAYYKIEEAFGRYKNQDMLCAFLENKSCVAIDCGAAPGGWTKFLIEKASCKTVYSVDPGELSRHVTALPGVCHMPVKLEEALPQLVEQEVKIDIFVSDMCLHELSSQVDFLLKASQPVLNQTVLFALTLKCVVGHSKTSHDAQVHAQVKRLESVASGVTVTHLFSNRKGERTVMGFLHS